MRTVDDFGTAHEVYGLSHIEECRTNARVENYHLEMDEYNKHATMVDGKYFPRLVVLPSSPYYAECSKPFLERRSFVN
jgi:hypothetical protein